MISKNKLLTEQAWSLQLNLKRLITAKGVKGIVVMNRLEAIHRRAYSRYLRRLEHQWA